MQGADGASSLDLKVRDDDTTIEDLRVCKCVCVCAVCVCMYELFVFWQG